MTKKRSLSQRIALWLLRRAERRALRAHGYRPAPLRAQDAWVSPDGDLMVHDRAVLSVKRSIAWRNSAGLRCVS